MNTRAVRIYGKGDLRLTQFDLPAMGDDEILARVVSDSLCMSSYKAAMQGADHKRVPNDIAQRPTIIGHEFCGEIVAVGDKWRKTFTAGDRFVIQPALNYKGSLAAPGYSYPFIGGDATYILIPNEVMEMSCLLPYKGDSFFYGSLAEPMSCIIGGFHASYHTQNGSYVHKMGIVEGGSMAILAGAGPMGLGAVDYAIHCGRRPGLLVVTDIDADRLERAAALLPPSEGAKMGVDLRYINTAKMQDPAAALLEITGGKGFDDVFVYAPVRPVVELGDRILGTDGCLNFFAGPTDPAFSANFNFYNVHYASTHIVGTSGGNTDDMQEAIALMEAGHINPSAMITHVGGLCAVIDATLHLPQIPGGKKLIYTQIDLPLFALADCSALGKTDAFFAGLAPILEKHKGLWSGEAEAYLLANAPKTGEAAL